MDARERPDPDVGLLSLPPLVARMTMVATARAGLWTVGMGMAASRRLVDAARTGQDVGAVLADLQDDAVRSARTLLGVDGLGDPGAGETDAGAGGSEPDPPPLRERGRELLARSAELADDAGVHPAFHAVLDQLAPDEARILRLLVVEGPQPVVDVLATGPLGIGTRDVARNLSMIGERSGCLHMDLVPVYLDNLQRLGLIRRGLDPLDDDSAYEVLQAQSDVSAAEERASTGPTRARVEKGCLELTHFGARFCETCLPLDEPERGPRRRSRAR